MLVIERSRGRRVLVETPEGERFTLRPVEFFRQAGDEPPAVEVELVNAGKPTAAPTRYRLTLNQGLTVRTAAGRRITARVVMLAKPHGRPWRFRLGFDAPREVKIYREELCSLVINGSTDAPGPA